MKQIIQVTLAFVILFCGVGYTYAQTSTKATLVTSNGDTLCVLSNKNTVPCDLVEEAENFIASGGKVQDPKTGKLLCDYKNRAVNCNMLGSDGTLKFTSYRENLHDAVMYTVQHKGKIFAAALLVLLLGVIRFGTNIVRGNKNSICLKLFLVGMVVITIALGMLFATNTANADVPIAPPGACTCTTSATQTCVTSTPGSIWVGFNDYTVSSCNDSGTYTTYVWPNTPPQFFYQGSETAIGDISLGNKHEAKGKEITPTLSLPADSIGQDTGVTCQRSGGVTGTLRYTGKLNYTVQGICLIGMCQYYSKVATNYSCY